MLFNRNGKKIAALRNRAECALRFVASRKALNFTFCAFRSRSATQKAQKLFAAGEKDEGVFDKLKPARNGVRFVPAF
jgi:hypothetical protein